MRKLKVAQVGDFAKDRYRGLPPKVEIRLRGRWLKLAGFEPGANVIVKSTRPGVLVIEQVSNG